MKKISKETLVRTIVLLITLVNTLLSAFGINPIPFSESDIYQIISALCTAAATIWAWWKNNSFTKEAIEADEIMHELKDAAKQTKKEDEVK